MLTIDALREQDEYVRNLIKEAREKNYEDVVNILYQELEILGETLIKLKKLHN